MKKVIKKMLLRAAQTAVISALVFTIFSTFAEGMPNIEWVLQSIAIACITVATHVLVVSGSIKALGKITAGDRYHRVIIISIVNAVASTILINVFPMMQDELIYVVMFSGLAVTLGFALFSKNAVASMLYGLYYISIYYVFISTDSGNIDLWLYYGVVIASGTILAGRAIRYAFIFLFLTDHFTDHFKEDKKTI